MPRELELPDTHDLFMRYRAGEAVQHIAESLGVGSTTIRRRFAKAGYATTGRIDIPDLHVFIARYRNGESVLRLSKEMGVSRVVFTMRLKDAGIKRRGLTESQLRQNRWRFMTPDQRRATVEPAHEGVRGRKATHGEKVKRALNNERTGKGASAVEHALAGWLRERGYALTQQKAVGKYNLDIAIHEPPVAVEVFGGGWHATGSHAARFPERVEYLLDGDWAVLIIWVNGIKHPLLESSTEHIVTHIEELGRAPSRRGKYRVILGTGELAPAFKTYLNHEAMIRRLHGSNNATGG